jgi:hypothetical protein
MASPALFPFGIQPSRLRRRRGVLGALFSLMLVFASSHCWCLDIDGGTLTVSAAANDSDTGKPSTDAHVPHCDHCMAHVITVAPPATSVAVEYVTGFYRLAAAALPEAADPASPFKPPRA